MPMISYDTNNLRRVYWYISRVSTDTTPNLAPYSGEIFNMHQYQIGHSSCSLVDVGHIDISGIYHSPGNKKALSMLRYPTGITQKRL